MRHGVSVRGLHPSHIVAGFHAAPTSLWRLSRRLGSAGRTNQVDDEGLSGSTGLESADRGWTTMGGVHRSRCGYHGYLSEKDMGDVAREVEVGTSKPAGPDGAPGRSTYSSLL